MARHGLKIVGDKNSILLRGDRQDFGVGNALQPGLVGGEKTQCRLVAASSFDDGMVEVGIRQESNHPSASPRQHLLPHTLECFFDVGRCRMRRNVSILLTPAFFHHLLHFVLVVQVEEGRAVDLLQAQC
jgi:hypothetical protein